MSGKKERHPWGRVAARGTDKGKLEGKLARLSEHINRPVDWPNLRHDREREIAFMYCGQGWAAGQRFERERNAEEAGLPEELRPVYLALTRG